MGDHDNKFRAHIPVRDGITHGPAEIDRRSLFKLVGSSLAIAGLSACVRKPPRDIVSRASEPEYRRPGQALYYSSTWTDGPYPYGTVVKTVDGRPVNLAELKAVLEETARKNPKTLVVISADRAVSHGQVVSVMDLAEEAGLARLAIATERKASAPEAAAPP